MSSPVIPEPPGGSALRRASWYHPDVRVGDAERTEVADCLARHYGDGRLDHEEFGDRLDRTMRAKTMAELRGVLADLPPDPSVALPVPPAISGSRRHRRKMERIEFERHRLQLKYQRQQQRQAERRARLHAIRWVPMLVALVILAIVVLHLLTHFITWLLLGMLAVLWLWRGTGTHRGSP
jgi:Domain of unknown function (DUF1707)